MMTGKIIGNLSVGLTQIAVWALILFAGLIIFSDRLSFLADIELSGSYLAVSLALLLISFIFTAALMATIGATMTSIQESQSVTGLIVLPMMLPFYFINVFISNPNGVVARLLSYIPLSAPLALSMRMAFTSVPAIEIAFVFALLIGLTVLMIWLASVAFKRGMLQYSQKLSLRSLFKKEANHA
jgi:ABC-2 type transport system permease protein